MEKQEHYRLFESGKRWMAALVLTAAVGLPLTAKIPEVQAAAPDTAPVTAAQEAAWQQNAANLKSALTAQNLLGLTWQGDKATSVQAQLASVKDEATLTQAWQNIAQIVGVNAVQKGLALPDLTSIANQAKVNAFLAAKPTVQGHTDAANNGAVLTSIAQTGEVSEQTPNPNYGQVLQSLTAFVAEATAKPVQPQANWETNKTALTTFLNDNKLTQLPAANGQQLGVIVSGVKDDAGITAAWQAVANALAINEAKQQLGLADATSTTNKAVIKSFLDAQSTDEKQKGKTNQAVINQHITEATPSEANPTPNFANGAAAITDYVDTAVKTMPSWQKNVATLQGAIAFGNWTGLQAKPAADQPAVTLPVLLAGVKDETGFNTAWTSVSQTVITAMMQHSLQLTDVTTAANAARLTQFLQAGTNVPGKTNADMIETLSAAGQPTTEQPLPDYNRVFTQLSSYIDAAAKLLPPIQQADWEINKTNLQSLVTAKQWTNLPTGNGQSVGTVVAGVKNAADLANAWRAVANAVATEEARQQLKLSDSTSAANQAQIKAFLDAQSLVVGHIGQTNRAVIADLILAGVPTTATPKPDFAQKTKTITDYIDQAVKAAADVGQGGNTNYNEVTAYGTLYVKNPNGAVIYSDRTLTQPVSGAPLAQGVARSYFRKVYNQGVLVGYNIGGTQYVRAADVQETPVAQTTVQDFNGTVRILAAGTAVYSDLGLTQPIAGRTLVVGSE